MADYSCPESNGSFSTAQCFCYWSGWFTALVSISGFLVGLAVICLPPVTVICYCWRTDADKPVEPAPAGTFRLYSALSPCLYRAAVNWLILVSCTLCRPFLLLESARMTLRRVDLNGTRLSLNAELYDYCKLVWAPTCVLNILTCCFYTCCGFAEKREDDFLDERTTVEGHHDDEPVVIFGAKPNWWYRLGAAVIASWSCGLLYPLFFVDFVKKSVEMIQVTGVKIASRIETSEFYVDVFLRTCVLNCFTCHLYSCCGFAHRYEAAYTDEHLTMPSYPTEHDELVSINSPTSDAGSLFSEADDHGEDDDAIV